MNLQEKFQLTELPITEAFLRQKRLIQDRGELALIEDKMRIHHLGYFSLLAGKGYRGGHYHTIKTEHFYVISGHLMLDLVDVQSSAAEQITLSAGTKATIFPLLAHRFRALQDAQVIEYYDGVFETTDDVAYDFDF